MPDAITNTSPLVYLYRIDQFEWLAKLFGEIWIPSAVVRELQEGIRRGYNVPDPSKYAWFKIVDANSVPSDWLVLDLGRGEIAAMALGLENPNHIVLLDDMRARKIAQAAGLNVWGTLRILLEAKAQGLTQRIEPHLDRLIDTGMWLSPEIRLRILGLAGEKVE
jgi:predicted nucleic acid-binding protein